MFFTHHSSSHGVQLPFITANANSSPGWYMSVVTLKTPFSAVSCISIPCSTGQCVQSPPGHPTSFTRHPGSKGKYSSFVPCGIPHVYTVNVRFTLGVEPGSAPRLLAFWSRDGLITTLPPSRANACEYAVCVWCSDLRRGGDLSEIAAVAVAVAVAVADADAIIPRSAIVHVSGDVIARDRVRGIACVAQCRVVEVEDPANTRVWCWNRVVLGSDAPRRRRSALHVVFHGAADLEARGKRAKRSPRSPSPCASARAVRLGRSARGCFRAMRKR